jgi:hypothetical protein
MTHSPLRMLAICRPSISFGLASSLPLASSTSFEKRGSALTGPYSLGGSLDNLYELVYKAPTPTSYERPHDSPYSPVEARGHIDSIEQVSPALNESQQRLTAVGIPDLVVELGWGRGRGQ